MRKENNSKFLNVPHLRFKEFSGEWENGRLNKYVDFHKGNGVAKADLSDAGHPCVLYGQLYTTYKNEVLNDVVSYTNIKSNNLVYSLPNDVIIPASGETPEDIATARCIIKDNVIIGGDLNILRPKNHSGIFLSYQLNGKRKYDIVKVAVGKSIVHLHNENLSNIVVYFPIYNKEEIKIVELLRLIDKRIETQMKIIEEIESLKNSIVIKIFGDISKFFNKWVKTKLSDILKERKQYAQKGSKYTHVTLSKEGVVDKTDRYNRDFLVKDEEKEYKVTKLNDICYNPANLKFGVICLNKYGDAIFSPIYVTYEINKNYNPLFIELALINSTFIGHIRKYEQGTVYERMAVCSEDFLKGNIYVPSNEEQDSIVLFFKSIDKRIELEKSILRNYELQKKYFLDNMFI